MTLPLSKEVLEVMQMVSRLGPNGSAAFHQPPRNAASHLYSNAAVIAFAEILAVESSDPSDSQEIYAMLERLNPDVPIEVEFTNEQKPH
jgi:hypothetical protein